MKIYLITLSLFTVMLNGCATNAPTNYELNRRSGLSVSVDKEEVSEEELVAGDLSKVKTRRGPSKGSMMTARLPPIVEKVWVYDQLVNNDQWMQGTWIFIEVDKGRWLPEIEVGPGDFLKSGKIELKRQVN